MSIYEMTDEEWEAELVRSGRTERNKTRPRPAGPRRWTKREVEVLRGGLDTFWLMNRPETGDRVIAARMMREHLEAERRRTHVVLAHVRGLRVNHAARYSDCCESAGNALARDVWGDKRDEMVVRFVELARGEDKSLRACEDLLRAVLDHGLPPDVLDYDPTGGLGAIPGSHANSSPCSSKRRR